MTKRKMLRLAPLMIATFLLVMAIVIVLLPHGEPSGFVSKVAPISMHQF